MRAPAPVQAARQRRQWAVWRVFCLRSVTRQSLLGLAEPCQGLRAELQLRAGGVARGPAWLPTAGRWLRPDTRA
jgi:hypothetical protein